MTAGAATATAQAAELAANCQIPAEGTQQRNRLIAALLDHLACLLAGQASPHVTPHYQVATNNSCTGPATAVGGTRLPSLLAAYVNGQTANALDWDDTLVGHPGSAIIPAAIAAAESGGGTLADAMRGVVAGYEIHWKLSAAGFPSAEQAALVSGFTCWETLAAGAAAAVARSAPVATVGASIRLAATHAPVSYLNKWYERPTPTVKVNLGWAAAIGVLSADLAEQGADGITDVLDGPSGFWRMAGSDRWTWTAPRISPEGIIAKDGFKRFPACWLIQENLVSVSKLIAAADSHDQSLTVTYGGPDSLRNFMDWAPMGSVDLGFSLPVLTGLLLGGHELDATTLYDAKLIQDAVRRAADSVQYERAEHRWVRVNDASGSQLQVDVEEEDDFDAVLTAAGCGGEDQVQGAADETVRGLTNIEVEAKYDRMVAPILGRNRAADLKALVKGAWDTQPVSQLTEYFNDREKSV